MPGSKDNFSSDQLLAIIEAAVAELPIPFCVFDDNNQPLVASDAYREKFASTLSVAGPQLHKHQIDYETMMREKLAGTSRAEEFERRIQTEMARHKSQSGFTKDMMIEGKWTRRMHAVSNQKYVATLEVPIDEMVQKATALVDAKRHMEHQANHDPLTNLPNRRALNACLDEVLDFTEGKTPQIAVLHVDLDKFKLINDTLGHDAGDNVLIEAAKILRSEVRSSDVVARVGGDEFILVCGDVKDQQGIANLAQRIVDKMSEPIYYCDEPCQIGASIGIAICQDFTTPERIVMDADIALYEAKRSGRGRFSFFQPSHRNKYAAFQKKVVEVREAIALRAFEPYFQPRLDAKTGEIVAVEAVPRWNHLEAGIRLPCEFVDALEEANLLTDLDEIIVSKSLKRVSEWRAEGIEIPQLIVSTSPASLARPSLIELLKWQCDEAEIPYSSFGIEVVESVVTDDQSGIVTSNVRSLKELGIEVTLKEFGTGNASISSLRYLAPDRIKIAREFICGLDTDDDLRTITGALISLGHNLGMQVCCESIETRNEKNTVMELGADHLQGGHFASPMPPEAVSVWIEEYEESLKPAIKMVL